MKPLLLCPYGLPSLVLLGLAPPHLTAGSPNAFLETDLVSDVPGRAALLDPQLVNPWGIAFSPTGPFWVADNGTGVSTLYNTAGAKQGLVVSLAPDVAGGPAAPTGVVFNGGSGFEVAPGKPARFLFATEGGTISGWNTGALPTQSIRMVDHSANGAIYKGLAIGNAGVGDLLYAADFHNGRIDVFDTSFAPVSLSGGFVDPSLPAGFAPFNIQNLAGRLYVTYALQDGAGEDDVAGAGNGYVDVFDLNGSLLQRLVSAGPLNSPWGLAIAPAGFGPFANDLLVGNFGDGRIHAFDPVTGTLLDSLEDPQGNPIEIDGLWGLIFGNGGNGGNANTLYFTAGIAGDGAKEDHGLFGAIAVEEPRVPETASGLPVLAVLSVPGLVHWYRRRCAQA